MKKRIKNKWLKALRSGDYKQTKKVLKDSKGYCCLGVLCDLHRLSRVDVKAKWNGKFYNSSTPSTKMSLPVSVMEWAGLKSNIGEYETKTKSKVEKNLIGLNDLKGYSFKKIANVIEKYF